MNGNNTELCLTSEYLKEISQNRISIRTKMEGKISTSKDLIVWQKAIQLATDVYITTKSFPTDEKFGIFSQLNRAVISIPSNIAEVWGRELSKNYLQFLRV